MKLSFIFFVALVSVLITSPSTQCNGLMRKLSSESQLSLTCRKTSNFGFCAYTLGTDPRSKTADVRGLANIALDKVRSYAKSTLTYLQELQVSVSGKEAHVVGTCIQVYKTVPRGIVLLNGNAYRTAKQAAVFAMNGAQKCQEQVNQNPSPKWQSLVGWNTLMHDTSRLSSDLIGLLG